MDGFKHQYATVNGVRLHYVEAGQGPLVVLLHGFPELWYSWRHQLSFLARHGYRAVAVDQRGYGRSSKFWQSEAYRIGPLVADVVGLVKALGEQRAVVVGHDWGAPIAWTAAWLHPETFRGVMGISVPFAQRGLIGLPGNPFGEQAHDEYHAELAGPNQDFYQTYFGTLGPIIDEFESDVRSWLRDIVYSVSGEGMIEAGFDINAAPPIELIRHSALCIPHGTRMRDRMLNPKQLPAWFDETDLDVFVAEYERTGLAGPLSYYRNLDADWHDLAPYAERKLTVPSYFLGAEFDVATWWGAEALARVHEKATDYRGTTIFDRCGHWIQQERPEDTNAVLLEFLQGLK
jgi:pimeloyl-ACP methyl ester carboxylesterase